MNLIKYKTQKENDLISIVEEDQFIISGGNLTTPQSVEKIMKEIFHIHKETEEYVYELCLNSKLKPVGIFEVSHGTVNQSLISPREFYQKALLAGAAYVIAIHNHPSGCCTPSSEDHKITRKLKEAGQMIGVPLIDFIIIGDERFSFKEKDFL